MAEGIKTWREASARYNGRRIGGRPEQPQTLPSQQKGVAQGNAEAIMGLPQDVSKYRPLQVTDPNSPDLGKFYFCQGTICRVIPPK